MKPFFLITIDTEGDNTWAAPRVVTTENSKWIPAFQALCEEYGFKVTYLTTHEMALCPQFSAFARAALKRHTIEIGAHLHPWNSPPIEPITADDNTCMPYAFEYPPELIRRKLSSLTQLLQDQFAAKPVSHRAGRWGFSPDYAKTLIAEGYLVDCSVTPGVSWRKTPGKPGGLGGPDYTTAPDEPYFIDLEDITRVGQSSLLEVPATIIPTFRPGAEQLSRSLEGFGFMRRVAQRLYPPVTWLRPNGRNRNAILRLLRDYSVRRRPHVEFVLHSSELMPGASPTFRTEPAIRALYEDLRAIFSAAADCFTPQTLGEFARTFSHPEAQ